MVKFKRPKLIILDCDGVIADTEPLTHGILAQSLSSYGLKLSLKQVSDLFIGGTMNGAEETAREMGADLPANWQDDIFAEMFAKFDEGVEIIPGIVDLIDRAEKHHVALAVASNGKMEKMRRSLGPSGLWDRLQPTIYSREDHAPKPRPDMLLHAMKIAGVGPDQTVMIDDSPAGCKSARNANVRCIGFATEGQDQALADVGAIPVNSMEQAIEMLDL